MSAKTRHNGLSADDRSDIRSTILQARKTLEDEFERQLERYGIYDDERVPVSSLSHLSVEDIATRKEIDAALERELEATDGLYGRAYQNYVREATKEYLNRLVGLKTIEARDLVTETLRTRAEYGNRSYMHYTVDEIAGELTDTSDDGLGVALDLAYQEIGSEIRVLFEESDYTALEPDFAVRRELLEELGNLGDDVWSSDEAMGWVYQYFGENEREEIDDRIDEENYKVQDTDLATKTQLFTPRYIVEWMVDNSLGRLWLEMHGDRTNIDDEDKCFYLAPLEESLIDRNVKDVREIKVLDPACGSGHMLFYAFDVLYEMYLEHSDVAEKHIPREILKNNLYGIDIDEGAAQIAALSLYVKAKSHSPAVAIESLNIVSANAVLINSEKKDDVLQRADSELERRVFEQVWSSFDHIREWGSLVRIEKQIEEIIEEELEEIGSTGQSQFTNDGKLAKQSSMISFSGDEDESWEQVKGRLLKQVSELAEESLEQNDPIEGLFADEVEKTVHLLDVFLNEYDVVISNPPYLSSRKIEDEYKNFLKSNFDGYRNLYASFIQRCPELTTAGGYSTLVTPEDFMTLYSFRKLRNRVISNHQFVEGAHLSGHSFSMKDRPFTIPFVIRCTPSGDFESSRFYRMTHDQSSYDTYKKKSTGLKDITYAMRSQKPHDDVYVVDQNSFLKIDRQPFVYWFGQDVLDLFLEYPQLGELTDVVQGLGTGDDDRFTRCWWETNPEKIGEKYRWLMTSGDDSIYYYSPERVVDWQQDGKKIDEYDGSRLQNREYYSKEGLTFRRASKHFTARTIERDQIFSYHAHFIDIDSKDRQMELLGYLCSSPVRFILQGLNPGLDFNVGDGKRIPIPEKGVLPDDVEKLSEYGVSIQKEKASLRETKIEFKPSSFINKIQDYTKSIHMLESDVMTLHGLIDIHVFDSLELDDEVRQKIMRENKENTSTYPHITNSGMLNEDSRAFRSKIPKKTVSNEEFESLSQDIADKSNENIRTIAEELEVSPYTVSLVKYNNNLYSKTERETAAGRQLSYYLGCVFGRWNNLEQITPSEDGILVFDNQFDDNVTHRIRECIEAIFDDVYKQEAEIEELLNKDMADWLQENFFRYHHTKEYRRRGQRIPIYWHLESDDGAFSCFLYYHAMDAETLPKLRGQYVDAKIDTLENRLESIESQLEGASGDRKPELNSELEEVQEQLDDVRDFGERLDELIDEGFEPDFEAGIWENIQQVDEYDLLQTELDKL
ncbi:BREX-1 system adenine-specific DNA-methyltransferase PglX [Halomontanus rarus]|uniref:BREX-1 system adenine-specific DNA-methyltransferase PglX n=1 Tax=Halomontanus rarus TaxID=3034020 RepID=UPI00293BBAC9|nr:BREX-1 system adenine-specific DNA-methyltransferase PglX [Halovivax sp. KZCA124]